MNLLDTAEAVQAYLERCEDRIAVIRLEQRLVLVVADGAGGSGNGANAAEFVVTQVRAGCTSCHTAEQWRELLTRIDHEMPAGEATAVIVDVTAEGITGASVGDSRAWIVEEDVVTDLTANQVRKPLLGSGAAQSVAFYHGPWRGTLLVATDGFFNYASRESITPLVATTEFYALPRKLIELVRLPSGEFWDDIGIVTCRPNPPRRSRQRYTIE